MSARIPLSTVGTTNYERVMGHAPHVLAPWSVLEETFFRESILPAELLEQVRRSLALGHGCEYCQAKAGPPDRAHSTLRTSLAVAYAEAFATDHRAIEASQIEVLRQHFTDPELVELVSFVSFMWAGGTFGKVLGIQPQQPPAGLSGSSSA
jgi:alkylhydroperoxidase family enzyme